MPSARDVLEQLVDEGRYPSLKQAWIDFSSWLHSHKGAGLNSVRPLELIGTMQTEISNNIEGEWLRQTAQHHDMVQAAEKFAGWKRSGAPND